jgi:hypothetical protein
MSNNLGDAVLVVINHRIIAATLIGRETVLAEGEETERLTVLHKDEGITQTIALPEADACNISYSTDIAEFVKDRTDLEWAKETGATRRKRPEPPMVQAPKEETIPF